MSLYGAKAPTRVAGAILAKQSVLHLPISPTHERILSKMPIASIFAFLQTLLADTPLWVLFVVPGMVAPIIALMIASLIKGLGAPQSGKTIYELANIIVSGITLNVVSIGFQDVFASRYASANCMDTMSRN